MEKKKEKKKSTFRLKIANMKTTAKGKAVLKLIYWLIFFIIMLIALACLNIFSKPKAIREKPPIINNETNFSGVNDLFTDMKTKDYKYNYSVLDYSSKELVTYNGELKEKMYTGYKESKLGIVKYKIKDDLIYQVFVDSEILNPLLFLEEEYNWFQLERIETSLIGKNKAETIIGNVKTIVYSGTNNKVTIKINPTKIVSILIEDEQKEYLLQIL